MFQDQAMDLFKGKVTEMLGENVAKNVNLEKVLQTVTGQIGNNASNEEWAKSLDSALEKHTKEWVNLDIADGQKIAGKLFGANESTIEKQMASENNIDEGKSKDLLALASSFVMENLGNAKAKGDLDITSLQGLTKIATNFLDKDGDGSVVDDLMDMGKKFLG